MKSTVAIALATTVFLSEAARAEIPAQCRAESEAFLAAAKRFKAEYDAHEPFVKRYMSILETRGNGPIIPDDPITIVALEHMIETSAFHLVANNAIHAAAVALECIQSQ